MKKNYLLLFLFALLLNKSYAQDRGCFDIQTNTVRPICRVIGQPNPSRTLTASPLANSIPRQTSSYTVAPTSYSWRSEDNVGDETKVEADDDWSNVAPGDNGPYVNLRAQQATTFNFCFFGEKYNKCMIGDNGVITFGIQGDPDSPGGTYTPGGFCPWAITDPIPSPNHIRNAIFGVYQDLLVDRFAVGGVIPPGTKISFFSVGVYPCRAFVASWTDVPLYSGGCSTTDLQSVQIVLFETTNIIEVHVKKRTSCAAWPSGNGGRGTIGIQNQAGNAGIAAPGRNAATFNTTNEAWRFTPSGPLMPIRYEWTEAGNPSVIIGTGPSLTVAPDVTTSYCVTAYLDGCDPVIPDMPSETHCIEVKVEDPYIGGVMDIRHCDTEPDYQIFDIGVNTNLVLGTRSRSDFEVIYYRSQADAVLGNAPISYTPNLTTLPFPIEPAGSRSQTLWARVDDYVTECHYEFPFTIRVLDCEIDLLLCDKNNDNVEIIDLNDFTGLIDASNIVDGINPPDYDITFHVTEADAEASIELTAAEIASYEVSSGEEIYIRIQSPTNPLDYVIKHFLVRLSPTPDVSIAGTTEICVGSTAPITLTGYPGSVVNYTDELGVTHTITLPASGSYVFTTPAMVEDGVYVYTLVSADLTIGGVTCSESYGTTAVVTAGDLPDAEIVTDDVTICEGTSATIEFLGTPGTQITYTDYAGTVVELLLDASGEGSIVTPTTLAPNASYTYTLTHVTTLSTPPCEEDLNDTVTITVQELPTATLTQIDSQVCLGNPSRVRISGTALANVTYTLNGTSQTVALDAAGEYLLTETLPAEGTYDYELVSVASSVAPFCEQLQTGLVTITVTKLPEAFVSAAAPRICENSTATFNFTGTANTTVYFSINGGAEQSRVLTPTTADPLIGEASFTTGVLTDDVTCQLIRVSTSGPLPCVTNLTDSATVIVNDLPTARIQANQIICDGTGTTVEITGTPNSIVTFTLNGGTNTDITLNAGGTATINTGILTADATYRLVSVRFTDVITCSRTLNLTSIVRITPLPTANFSADPNICSNRTAEITFDGTPNATVNFTSFDGTATATHSIQLDGAGNGTFTTTPITATTTFDLVNAVSLASGATPSCTAPLVGSLTITPTAAPIINFTPTPLEVCDDNTDGIALFNLTLKNDEIIGAGSTLLITYHETERNALDGVFAKADPYENLVPAHPESTPYIIWVRVQEVGGSECPSIAQLRLIVNRTPQPVAPSAIEICDNDSADGFAIFPDLRVREAEMLTRLNNLDTYTFNYYLNETDAKADSPTAPTLPTTNYPNSNPYSQIIWVRVSNSITGCFKAVPLQLIVNPNPVIPAPGALAEYTLCDYNNPGDEVEIFDLESRKEFITTVPGMDIQFYFDDAAVTAGTPLPLAYENEVSPAQTIVVVVTNTATGCSSRTTLTLRVRDLPLIIIPAETPQVCDDDGNNSGQFDLDALIPEITGGADYIISFHETRENAEDDVFPYTSPYDNLASGVIFIRAEDRLTGCFSVAELPLIVNPIPEIPDTGIPELVVCDTNADRIRRVDLVAHAEPYLLPQPIAGDYIITYYLNETDADLGIGGRIATPANHLATNGDVIWVRITNDVTKCYDKTSFQIVINPAIAFPSVEYSLCDEGLPNDGFTEFDLTSQNVFFGAPDYSVAYSTLAGVAIGNPEAYTNVSPGVQTIRVTTTNIATGCVSTSTLTIRVVPLPNPKLDPAAIEECDDDSPGDGLTEFDLTVRETYIKNGATNATLLYYIDRAQAVADGDQGTTFPNAIATPTAFTNTVAYNQTIYVLVVTNFSNPTVKKCYQIVELDLIVNPLPALGDNGIIDDFVACVSGSTGVHTFTLSDHNLEVLAPGLDPADYTISYYDSEANAEVGTAVGRRPNTYTNVTNPEPIWVRVKNNSTPCFNVGTFNLVVDEMAVANQVPPTEPLITVCDDVDGDNDGFATFDLTPLNDIILGNPAPANLTVHYYDNEALMLIDKAEGPTTLNPGAIADISDYDADTREIIALVINRTSTTGCAIEIRFNLTVNKLPEVTDLEGGFFCVDPVTSLPLNTFELNAVVDPAAGNYTYEWTRNGVPYPVADNTQNPIYVDEDGVYSVIVTNTDTGCISEPSQTAIVEPTSNAIAEAFVTGYFTDNATITVVVDTTTSLGDYEFKLDEGQWQDSNVFSPVATGEHEVYIRDKNAGGCDPLDPIVVTVVNYPKYFTPNGDGIHDTWTIAGLGDTARIYIFDRYGKLVKQIASGDEGEGWNGTMNGQPLPSTDYWFKVEYLENNVMKEFKAHFSLKR